MASEVWGRWGAAIGTPARPVAEPRSGPAAGRWAPAGLPGHVQGGEAAERGCGALVDDVDRRWSIVHARPGDELVRDGRFGAAVEVTLRIGGATGERLAVVAPSVPDDLALPSDVTVVGEDELAEGRHVWFHDEVAGRRFRISARSFFQTRTDGAEALVAAVRDAGGDAWGHGRLADLYGGVGLFASTLGEGMSTVLVESARSSVADAEHNLADRDATVVRSSVDRWRPSPADLVVADPPRAGLGKAALAPILATGAHRLVLVSCDAAAFGRDAGLLAEAGFERRSTVLVDLFPHTPRVELVSRFDRKVAG